MVSPASIYVGESLAFTVPDTGFESVSVVVRGPTSRDMDAVEGDGGWAAPLADTSDWKPGMHRYEVWGVFPGGARRLVEAGRVEVIASIASTPAGTDLRSAASRNVEMLEAYLSNIGNPNSDQSVRRYRINNRELENHSIADIRALLDYWRGRLAAEERKESGKTGRGRIVFHI